LVERLRAREKLADTELELSGIVYERGVDGQGFARLRSKGDHLRGEQAISGEHIKNNKDVRELLGKSGIKPELLPPEEDIKKLERRLNSEAQKLVKSVKTIVKGNK